MGGRRWKDSGDFASGYRPAVAHEEDPPREDDPAEHERPPGKRTLTQFIHRSVRSSTDRRETMRAGRPGAFTLVMNALSRPGRPLPERQRAALEGAAARPLAEVRIHVDEPAAKAADAIDARAFAVGRDIFFGAGEFSPDTPAGDRLLAHEVAHTIQHPVAPVVDAGAGPRVSEPGDASEAFAEQFADAFTAGALAPDLPVAGAAGLLRTARGGVATPVAGPAPPAPPFSSAPDAGGGAEVLDGPESQSADDAMATSMSVVEEPAPRAAQDGTPSPGQVPAAPGGVSGSDHADSTEAPGSVTGETQSSMLGAHPVLVGLAQQRARVIAHGEVEAARAQVAQGPIALIAQARVVFRAQAELQRTLARNEIEAARLAFEAGVGTERRGLLLAAQAESLRVRQSAHEQADEIPTAAALQAPAIMAAAIAATRGASVPEHVRPQVEAAVGAVASGVVSKLTARAEKLRLRVRRNAAAVADAIQAGARGLVARLDARSAEIGRAWAQAQQALLARIGQREEVGLRALAEVEARARGARAAEAGRQVAGARATARAIGAEMLRVENAVSAQLRNLPPGEGEEALAPALEAVQAYGARGRDMVSAAAPRTSGAPGGDLAGALAEATLMLVQDGAAARGALRETVQERSLEAVASIRAEVTGARTRWRTDADRAIATTAADCANAVTLVSGATSRLGHRFTDEAKRAAAEAQLSQGDRVWAAIRHSMSTNLLFVALAGLAVVGVAAALELSVIATGIAAFMLALKLVGLSAMATMLVLGLVRRLGSLGKVPGFGDMPWYEQAARVVGAAAAAAGDATLLGPAAEAATGRDLVTGRELTREERAGLATDVVMGVLTAYLGHALHKGVNAWSKTTPLNDLPRKAPPVLTEESLAASEAERAALEAADGQTRQGVQEDGTKKPGSSEKSPRRAANEPQVSTPSGVPTVERKGGTYTATDPATGELLGMAEVGPDGYVELAIYTDAAQSPIRGGAVFKALVEAARADQGQVSGIRGLWYGGDNLSTFNKGVLAGQTPEAAAATTFTGKMASRAGYPNARIDYSRSPRNPDGSFQKAEVFFSGTPERSD